MSDFIASNGIPVIPDGLGGYQFVPELGQLGLLTGISADCAQALREFFQKENDDRLGRWRWPENPDYVVYPRSEDVLVLFEMNGEGGVLYRRGDPVHDFEGQAARAYFDAHPEPKPWDTAVPGEYWAFQFSNWDVEVLCKRTDGGWKHEGKKRRPLDRYFGEPVSARRVWPEVKS